MGAIQDIMSQVDVNQIASILGTDPQTAEQAAEQAVGSLVTNMEGAADSEDQARNFANALGQHMNSPVLDNNNGVNLDSVDVNDGVKIVNHVIPANQQQALFGGAQGSLVQKLLPLLAPIVMAYLAKRLQGQGGLGSVLGSVLGGAAGQQGYPQQGGMGGGMGDILGQILGGGQSRYAPQQQAPASQGGLGDILGSLLGGGQADNATYQQPTQPQYQQPTSGGDLRMGDPATQGAGYDTSAAASAGGVGDLLKNILFGR